MKVGGELVVLLPIDSCLDCCYARVPGGGPIAGCYKSQDRFCADYFCQQLPEVTKQRLQTVQYLHSACRAVYQRGPQPYSQ